MDYFFGKRVRLLFIVLVAAAVAAMGLPAAALGSTPHEPLTLQQIHDVMQHEVSGQKALENAAYAYRGWRNTGGPWFNQVENWIADQLDDMGFTPGEGSSDYCYWIQNDYRSGNVWIPQYLSFAIVGPDGDADPAHPAAYHFDHPAIDTFDPTSPYYPSYMTQQWVLDHQRTPEEEAMQDRCHLATNSAFTAPIDTPVSVAETPAGGAILADLVDVGTVTRTVTDSVTTYSWAKNTGVSLSGKVIFTSSVPPASMSDMIGLAHQTGAKAVMTPAALSDYSHPVIDGVEWYPNNVRYAGCRNPGSVICLNISYQDARYLTGLCDSKLPAFPQVKLFAIGGTKPYSVAPDASTTLHTLIAEIRGTTKADERVMEMAHVQEPGAEDNASGVGQQLEMLRATKHLIDTGALPRPRRTMTFMWGNEMTMSALYKGSHPAEYNKIVAAFSNDMVGADQATTGAVFVLDKMPDPSARYAYQTEVLAGTTPPTPTQFLRGPDTHTLWGAGSLDWYPYDGHYLTDLYFESGKLMEQDSPTFDTRYRLRPSPWEGGSDAQPFLWNTDTVGGVTVPHPIPALATFFFTDYTYHSSMDTMKALSVERLYDVGLMSGVFAYYRADADVKSAKETMDIVKAAAHQRFTWEKNNTRAHFQWALTHPYGTPPTVDGALHEAYAGTAYTDERSIGETQVLNDWKTWYQQAVISARDMFAPSDGDAAYDAKEADILAAVTADAGEALANAAHLFAASHFFDTSVVINDDAEWTLSRDVGLTLAAGSHASGGVTGMRFSADGSTWPDDFQPYATHAAYTLPAGDDPKTVYVQFQDAEGNVSDAVSDSIKPALPCSATLNLVPSGKVLPGTAVTFRGTVTRADGSPVHGAVTIQQCLKGDDEWVDWQTTRLNADGSYARTVTMTVANRVWQFRTMVAGNVDLGVRASYSVVRQLTVLPTPRWKVTLALSATKVKPGASVSFRGTVKTVRGKSGSGNLILQKRRKGSAQWLNWRSVTLKSGGRYVITVKMTAASQVWQFRAKMPANARNATGYSPTKTLTVTRR